MDLEWTWNGHQTRGPTDRCVGLLRCNIASIDVAGSLQVRTASKPSMALNLHIQDGIRWRVSFLFGSIWIDLLWSHLD